MKTMLRGMSACAALALAVVVASCDETQMPTEPETAQTGSPGAKPEAGAPAAPMFDFHNPVIGDCLNEDPDGSAPEFKRFNNATCTANDVEIKVLQVVSVDGAPHDPSTPIECIEGTQLEVGVVAFFGLNAEERYDISYYLAEDGGDAKRGTCFHGFLDPIEVGGNGDPTGGPPYDGPYFNYELNEDPADVCGDAAEDDEVSLPGIADDIAAVVSVPETITLFCQDPVNVDGQEFLEFGTCTAWDINKSNGESNKPSCEDVDDAVPGTPSKCNCDPALLPVNIRREATVQVVKNVVPDADPGTFDIEIRDFEGTQLELYSGGDGSSNVITITWFADEEGTKNFATVEEVGADLGSFDENTTPSAFDFYTTSYTCVNGSTIGPTSGTGPETLTLTSGDAWVCTFTNTRIQPPAVTVTKTANESFDRTWGWTLDKDVFKNGAVAGDCSSFDGGSIEGSTQTLQLGQDLRVCYQVTATGTGPTDTNHSVSGTISVSVVSSSAPYSGSFNISDAITPGDIASADVDCDDTAGGDQNQDLTVAQGGSLSCTYSVSLTEAQADAATTNTATAAVTWNTGDTDSQTGTDGVDFSAATPTTELDETADVTDIWNGTPVFTIWDDLAASTGQNVSVFWRDLSCPDYGDYLIPNDAYLDSSDGTYDLEDAADVTVSCPAPPNGCTLTQGFWRTHSQFGPAPYDEGWEVIAGGASANFGLPSIESDESYFEVLWDPGKGGNAFYKLAHQYIAAYLNIANGSDPTPVSVAMADAASILDHYDTDANPDNSIPKRGTDWCTNDGGSGACSGYNSDRQYAMHLNNLLTQYNEGNLGVPHCDDDAQSLLNTLN